MIKKGGNKFWQALSTLVTILILLSSVNGANAEEPKEDAPALAQMPTSEELSILKKRLQIVRKDIEAFRVFAENFKKNGDTMALEQLKKPVDDFLARHVDKLLAAALERKNLETVLTAAEITFRKAQLFMYMGRVGAARNIASDLREKGPYAPYQKNIIVLPGDAGITTTLSDGYKLLDAELSRFEGSERTGRPAFEGYERAGKQAVESEERPGKPAFENTERTGKPAK